MVTWRRDADADECQDQDKTSDGSEIKAEGRIQDIAPEGDKRDRTAEDDHRAVEEMFDEYEDIRGGGDEATKEQLAQKICAALKVHTQIEEEISIQRRGKPRATRPARRATVEHADAKNLIRRSGHDPADDLYDAKVRVWASKIRHHVQEEEEALP